MVWGRARIRSELPQAGSDEHEESDRAEEDQPDEESSDARAPGSSVILRLPPAEMLQSVGSLSLQPVHAKRSIHVVLLRFFRLM